MTSMIIYIFIQIWILLFILENYCLVIFLLVSAFVFHLWLRSFNKSHKFCNKYTILFLVFLAPFWWASLFSLCFFFFFSRTKAQEILTWCASQGKGHLCLSTGWKLFSLCGFWKMFVDKMELKIQPNPRWNISSPFLSTFLNQDFASSVNIPLKRAAWMASMSLLFDLWQLRSSGNRACYSNPSVV